MFQNYNVIVVCPAGRRESLGLLYKSLKRSEGFVDMFQIWTNTENYDDMVYLNELADDPFVRVIVPDKDEERRSYQHRGSYYMQYQNFYRYCTDASSVYLKLDDDIVFWEPDAIESLIRFRLDNPRFFLVGGNVINNGLTSYIHQRIGAIPDGVPDMSSPPLAFKWDNDSYNSKEWADYLHRLFIARFMSKETEIYQFPQWILSEYERFSINCVSWFGEEFAKFYGSVPEGDDEIWLTEYKSKELSKPNCIYGGPTFCHLGFIPQRNEGLDTELLCGIYNQMLE